MLRFKSLASGSAGNAAVVEAQSGATTTRLLVDCGLNLKTLDARLGAAGLGAHQIDGIFITHEHSDHIGHVKAFALRNAIPVWMSHGTFTAISRSDPDPAFTRLVQFACDEQTITMGDLQIIPFTVPHDAREPLQLTCTDGHSKLGVLTDLGHATAHTIKNLHNCTALVIECNHCPTLLEASRYPAFLKDRVAGLLGHLSNRAAAEVVHAVQHKKLKHVVAAHLSRQNNHPKLARLALSKVLGCHEMDIAVADQQLGSPWLTA